MQSQRAESSEFSEVDSPPPLSSHHRYLSPQSGFTALHLAAQNGHVKAVQELINGAADIQALNDVPQR